MSLGRCGVDGLGLALEQALVGQPEGGLLLLHLDAAVAHSGQDAPPVGIAAVDGRLHPQGAHHFACGTASVAQGGGALHQALDELGGSLGVADDGSGQVEAKGLQAGGEGGSGGVTRRDGLAAGQAVGHDHYHVVGTGIAVHVDHVKGGVHGLAEGVGEEGGLDRDVGGDEGEHSGQVGMDHAGAFGHAAQRVLAPGLGEASRPVLGTGVGGHDGASELQAAIAGQLDAGDSLLYSRHQQEGADDAGGGYHHIVGGEAQFAGGQLGHLPGVAKALVAGGGVGAAAVADDGLSAAIGQVLLSDDEGCRPHPVAGEDGGGSAGRLGVEEAQVQLVLVAAQASAGSAGQEATRAGNGAVGKEVYVAGHSIKLATD